MTKRDAPLARYLAVRMLTGVGTGQVVWAAAINPPDPYFVLMGCGMLICALSLHAIE